MYMGTWCDMLHRALGTVAGLTIGDHRHTISQSAKDVRNLAEGCIRVTPQNLAIADPHCGVVVMGLTCLLPGNVENSSLTLQDSLHVLRHTRGWRGHRGQRSLQVDHPPKRPDPLWDPVFESWLIDFSWSHPPLCHITSCQLTVQS